MSETETGPRLVITPRASTLLRRLRERHGPLLFHQSGGCCDGSVPLCLRQSEFRIGTHDVLFDIVEGVPFYVDEFHFQFLSKAQLLLDVVPSQSDSFSLESSEKMRFVTKTIVCLAKEGR